LINELSIIFNRLGINTYDVLEAAGTKWNFLNFKPGLVGGHCIGVDPYYLTHKAKQLGYHAKIINSGRYVNDSMGFYVAKQAVKKMIGHGKNPMESKVLIMGATFKEDVSDIRNSKIVDVISELQSFACSVDIIDPHADTEELFHEYGFRLKENPTNDYDAIIVAVNHREYSKFTEADFKGMMRDDKGIIIDLKGIYRHIITNIDYWSL
jgi:UDP-N-acetyl-D-galactosamine dehydrogenase